MATNEGFQQVKIDAGGTYGGYNQATNQAVAFPTEQSFKEFFGANTTFNPNAPLASFNTGGLLGANAGKIQSISMDSLNPATPLTMPQAQPQANPLEATAASAQATSKSLDQYIKELTPPETETSKQYGELTKQITELLPDLGGRGQSQLQAETDAGLPELKKKLSEINSQILQKTAEAIKSNVSYEQILQQIENQQGIPMSIITGQQAQQRKLQLAESNNKSADIMLLQAVASGLQGNLSAMQGNIDRAIDLRYADREDTLNLKMQQLQLLEGKLDKEEQVTKQALERKYQDEQIKIEEEKAKAKDNINLAFSANVQTPFVNKNGEFYDARTGKGFATPEEFFKASGVKSFEEAYRKGVVTDLNAGRVADLDFVAQLRAKYPDAGININDTATSAQQKLNNSRIYRESIRPPSTGSGGGLTPGQILTFQNQLQDNMRVDPAIKNYTTLVDFGVPSVISDFQSGNANNVTDTILMRTLAKVTDPTTGVREGEYETFESSVGALNRLTVLPQKWVGKGKLTDEGRKQMIKQVQDRYNAALSEYSQSYNYYSGQASQMGVNISPAYQSSQVNKEPAGYQATVNNKSYTYPNSPSNHIWVKDAQGNVGLLPVKEFKAGAGYQMIGAGK